MTLPVHRLAILLCLSAAVPALPSPSAAQDMARPLATQAIDETKVATLRGSTHPLAQARFDRGAVTESFPAGRILLMLNRAPEREATLRQFLSDAHNPGSAAYHKWLTPEQFGDRFGAADSDIQTVAGWLSSHGFQVARVTKSKTLIEFSGTAANVREAFHAEIHEYSINNEVHHANATELAIPEALAPVIRGVSPINDFRLKPYVRSTGPAIFSHPTGKAVPLFTSPNGIPNFYAIGPEDFATQYDLAPLYASGINGSNQIIGILGESNIDVSLPNAYRQLFHLPSNSPHVVIDGGDPGVGPLPDSDLEAYLDVELSGAVAPNATVNLYISDGSQLQDPINLAVIRAIEDNQASVLSLSLGACEASLAFGGNQFWSSVWEQAAAQGQTVLVSTGDTGSAGCDFPGESTATQGLAVSGIASTPWNVAVGGTDFFYLNFAAGPSSAAPSWNQTNDAGNGSLKASLPEQPWDGPFGLNIFQFPNSTEAGGGVASSCIQSVASGTGGTICVSGYPKPIWQTAPGVPNDGARDLPDVSLFAANGQNLSAYPICAAPGDCVTSAGQPQVSLIGGTSASAPAMAGIMALVNQEFGRQGQANFTLYALARKSPAVFHDIVAGTNNVPCQQGSPNCSLDTNGDGLFSLQKYAAGTGYDLATGLGSIDAKALVTNWNETSFTPTSTTLSLSPSSILHGTPVTFTANVSAASGSGAPTGDVAIATTSALPLQRNEAIPLANGTASEPVDFFPGGTYQVKAQYGGDGVFGASTSSPVNLTVTPEPSTIFFNAFGPVGVLTNAGSQTTYGQRWIFNAEPYGMNGDQIFGLATGNVTFSDGNNSQQVSINSQGSAGYSPGTLTVGTHNIMLSYAGDASYQASTAGPFTFIVGKGAPNIIIPFVEPAAPIGGNLLVNLVIGTGFGTAPTGNIGVSLGAQTLVVPLSPVDFDTFPYASATAIFTNLQTTGSLSLSVNYSGDSNWIPASVTYPNPIVVAASTRLASTTALAVSPASINRFESSNFTATVRSASGNAPAPTGTVVFYVDGQGLPVTLVQSGPGTSVASPSVPVSAEAMTSGNNQVVAVYGGDSVYNQSSSTPATVTVDLGTFSLTLGVPRVAVPSGQSASVPIVLTALNGFSAPLSLSCVPSSGSIGCTVNPSTANAGIGSASTLTINAYVLTGGQIFPARKIFSPHLPASGILGIMVLFFLAVLFLSRWIPAETRFAFGTCILGMLILAGCGGGATSSSPPPPPPPPPVKTAATPGTYSVVVNASANGVVRNISLTVVVQ